MPPAERDAAEMVLVPTGNKRKVRRLILFDIDGTLVDCGRQIRPLFAEALHQVFGTAGDLEGYDFAGKTDPQIVLELIEGAGIGRAAILPRVEAVRDRYLGALGRELRVEKMRLLPGVVEVLTELAAHDGVTLGLLSGNWESGGRIKLAPFDLNRFFPFGAFGDDQFDRFGLPALALR